MSENHVKIQHNWRNMRDTVIEINELGNLASQFTTIKIDMQPGRPPKVEVGLHLPMIDFEADAVVELVLTDRQAETLIGLGWIPPNA
jgi:hypothetical protein